MWSQSQPRGPRGCSRPRGKRRPADPSAALPQPAARRTGQRLRGVRQLTARRLPRRVLRVAAKPPDSPTCLSQPADPDQAPAPSRVEHTWAKLEQIESSQLLSQTTLIWTCSCIEPAPRIAAMLHLHANSSTALAAVATAMRRRTMPAPTQMPAFRARCALSHLNRPGQFDALGARRWARRPRRRRRWPAELAEGGTRGLLVELEVGQAGRQAGSPSACRAQSALLLRRGEQPPRPSPARSRRRPPPRRGRAPRRCLVLARSHSSRGSSSSMSSEHPRAPASSPCQHLQQRRGRSRLSASSRSSGASMLTITLVWSAIPAAFSNQR